MAKFQKLIYGAAMVLLAAVASTICYQMVVSNIASDIYRDRLVDLSDDYNQLRSLYNQAVRKTAVTELLVADGKVSVQVRRIDGEIETVETPFDPASEIYIDYVVLDGRLWVRRLFDEYTPASEAVVIDSKLVDIDWDAAGAKHGKAAYRQFDEGRWAVTVTGDGSIGLEKLPADAEVDLIASPLLREFAPLEEEVQSELDQIGVADVARRLMIGSEVVREDVKQKIDKAKEASK